MSYIPFGIGNVMNQYRATSGAVPSASMIDQIIGSALDAANRNKSQNRMANYYENSLNYARERDSENRSANAANARFAGATGLLGTALSTFGKPVADWIIKPGEKTVTPKKNATGIYKSELYDETYAQPTVYDSSMVDQTGDDWYDTSAFQGVQ